MAQQYGIAQAVLATPGQVKEVIRLFEDAFLSRKQLKELAARCCSDKDSAQRLIERAGELKAVRKFFAHLAKKLSNSDFYADQVVESTYGYLSGYRKARPIDEQIAVLRQYDWGRKIDWALSEVQQQLLTKPAPQGSEGYFAVVFDQTMVTHFEEDPSVDQSGPVTLALNALSKQREGRLQNYRRGGIGPQHYRRNKRSAEKMKQLWESQGCPTGIILIPAQLGIEHRGKSVLRARVVIRGSEFPLDSFEIIQMLLTHENRLKHRNELLLDLPGAEYSPGADGVFDCTLCLEFCGDEVWFGSRNADDADSCCGSVSGLLPQQIDS